jgi:2-polyprenyl-3-methyl-5-hydroxy-6-metoxy-1,4-benzoquinol methylase
MAVRIDPEANEPAALARIGAAFDDARVLEVGCGDGRVTKSYAHRARSVVAIEPEQTASADFRCEPWPAHVEFQSVGIDAFAPGDRRFDVVLFSWSL